MTIWRFACARIIILMIRLPYPESLKISYCCRHSVSTRWEISDKTLGNRSLFAICDKYHWEILFSNIWTLSIFLSKIMNLKEYFCKRFIVGNGSIVPHFHRFYMTSISTTYFTILGVLRLATCIADRCREHSLDLSKIVLHSPETSSREDSMTNILHISIRSESKWEWIRTMTSITGSKLLTMKYMSNMTSTTLTCYLGTTTITIESLSYISGDSLFKGWPATSRIKLRITRKKW